MAAENGSVGALDRLNGRNAMLGRLLLERRQEERGKRRPHLVRVGLAIDPATKIGRCRQALRVPTEVLARHADAGFVAVVIEHGFEMAPHRGKLLGQPRIRQPLSGAQIMDRLIEEPRPSVGATPDHHAIRTRLRQGPDRRHRAY